MKFEKLHKITLIFCLLLPAAVHGQIKFEATSSSIPGGSIKLDPAPFPAPGGDEIVRKAFQNVFTARSYRTRGEMIGLNGASFELDQEFVAPNRIRSTVRSVNNGPNIQVSAVIIGKDGYLNVGGKWTRRSVDDQVFDFSKVKKQIDDLIDAAGDKFEITSSGTINGLPVVTYQIASQSGVTFKVSVGSNDNMLYRVDFASPADPTKGFSGEMITLTLSDYNTDIKIEPPM